MTNLGEGTEFGANELNQLQQSFQPMAAEIHAIAQNHVGDSRALLALLRLIESLHREIRDGLFQQSLPANRQALYALLRDIEAEGGWPYIHRMKLQSLLVNLVETAAEEDEEDAGNSTNSVGENAEENLTASSSNTLIATESSTSSAASSAAETES